MPYPSIPQLRAAALALALLALAAAPHAADAAPAVPEGAFAEGAIDDGDPRVEARLLIDASLVSPGDSVGVGVLFELDRGWHLYWRNPGQSGLPTELHWQVEGASVGPIQWPAPRSFSESDGAITTYGYTDEVLLASRATFVEDVRGERNLAVDVDFLVCEVRCIPGRFRLERTVTVANRTELADDETREIFAKYGALVPAPAGSLGLQTEAIWSQSAIRPGDEFRAALAVLPCEPGAEGACPPVTPASRRPADDFIPDANEGIEIRVTGSRPHPFFDDGFVITLAGNATSSAPESDQRLRGVLAVAIGGEARHVDVDLPLPAAAAGTAVVRLDHAWLLPGPAAPGVSLGWAILFAFAGGLILNLMPCVLPVLAIKVFGIAELAHRERREIAQSGVAYAAGILGTMLLLAASVVALRALGTSVGWGFQFQEPVFVAAVTIVMVLFALNLFGVFEIAINATGLTHVAERATGFRRSFFEGLLAVVVATPCSAPFLGTAVGFAFAGSSAVIAAIFLAVGLGLALPYLLITLVPGWARLVPRSGAWMIHLRTALGFALIGTAVWLLWILGRLVGVDGVAAMLALLSAIAFAGWAWGRFQVAGRVGLSRSAAAAMLALAIAGLVALPLDATETRAGAAEASQSGAVWRSFDRAAVQAELEAGHPVFVYFTADWCLTCKVNESLVLENAEVLAELERLGFVTFKADWTLRDETIRAELARFGRAGVPMYLVYGPAAPERPEVLPELLTVDGLVDALRRAARAPPGTGLARRGGLE